MSATSKLVGFSVTTEDEGGYVARQADASRRRYLMRYVVGALGIAGVICVAAGIRLVVARSAAAHEEARPLSPVPVVAAIAAPAPEPVQPQLAPVVNAAPAPEPAAQPAPAAKAETTQAPAPEPAAQPAQVTATPAPKHAAAAPAAAPPARAPAPAPVAHPKAHASSIVHAAPF